MNSVTRSAEDTPVQFILGGTPAERQARVLLKRQNQQIGEAVQHNHWIYRFLEFCRQLQRFKSHQWHIGGLK